MKKTLIAASLLLAFGAANAANAISNGSFETSNVDVGGYTYSDTVAAAPWSFAYGAGIATNGSGFGGTALDGTHYAFLQMANSTVSQSFSGAAGSYTVDFSLAARAGMAYSGAQSVIVTLDNTPLVWNATTGSTVIQPVVFTPTGAGGWINYSLTVAAATAGTHTLTFKGLGYNGQDTSVFLDNVSVAAPVPEPESYAMMLAGLGLMGAIARRRKSSKQA